MTDAPALDRHCVEFLRTRGLLRSGMHYLLAVSGGMDSMTMLHVFGRLGARWNLKLTVMYVDHGLRPEAGLEAERVAAAAAESNADFVSERIDVRKVADGSGKSLQSVGRRLRYAALENTRDSIGADIILTAHHADDQAETVLMRFLTGAGIHGLAGIRPVNGCVVRPFLGVTRAELERYAEIHGIAWCHDVSNDSDDYLRNALRHHVIPVIRQHVNPGLASTLGRTASLVGTMESFLMRWVADAFPSIADMTGDGISLAVQGLKEYLEFQQFALIREGIRLCRAEPANYEETLAVRRLLDRTPGSRARLHDGCLAVRERDVIRLFSEKTPIGDSIVLVPGSTVRFGSFEISACEVPETDVVFTADPSTEFADADAALGRLRVRPWVHGDWLIPLGFQHRKNVSDLLTDEHIPRYTKQDIPVLECDGMIVWVCGVRLDDRFRISSRTKRVLHLQCREVTVVA